jgi:hypothetical protein
MDNLEKSCIFLGSIRYRILEPCIITGAGNAEKLAHHLDTELVSMRIDEPIGKPGFAWDLLRRHGITSSYIKDASACP